MSLSFGLLIIREVLVSALLVYGFKHEKRLIAFEEKVKMIVVVNVRRYKRKKALQKQQELAKNMRLGLHTVNSPSIKAAPASHRVA